MRVTLKKLKGSSISFQVAAGTSVILCEHTNTERGYLDAVLRSSLQRLFDADGGESVEVVCSQVDRDPLETV